MTSLLDGCFSMALRSDARRPDARWPLLGELSLATATLRTYAKLVPSARTIYIHPTLHNR